MEWLADIYPWVKALHVISIIAWMAGMLYLPRLYVYHADKAPGSDFRRTVEELSGQNLGDCYQCGKCSAGCPVLPDIELSTNRIIRMVQLGLKDDVLSSPSLWCCTACGTCNGRCPMSVDIVRVMDTLRGMVEDLRGIPGALEVWTFYRAFLDCVREFG